MCDYCGCRDIEVIKDLSRDHEAIQDMSRLLKEAIKGEDYAAAEKIRPELGTFLVIHGLKEEVGVYRQLANIGLGERVEMLEQEHQETAACLARPIHDHESGEQVLQELRNLHEHIHEEEFDKFPGAMQMVDPRAWDEAEADIRAALAALRSLSEQSNAL